MLWNKFQWLYLHVFWRMLSVPLGCGCMKEQLWERFNLFRQIPFKEKHWSEPTYHKLLVFKDIIFILCMIFFTFFVPLNLLQRFGIFTSTYTLECLYILRKLKLLTTKIGNDKSKILENRKGRAGVLRPQNIVSYSSWQYLDFWEDASQHLFSNW